MLHRSSVSLKELRVKKQTAKTLSDKAANFKFANTSGSDNDRDSPLLLPMLLLGFIPWKMDLVVYHRIITAVVFLIAVKGQRRSSSNIVAISVIMELSLLDETADELITDQPLQQEYLPYNFLSFKTKLLYVHVAPCRILHTCVRLYPTFLVMQLFAPTDGGLYSTSEYF